MSEDSNLDLALEARYHLMMARRAVEKLQFPWNDYKEQCIKGIDSADAMISV